jgi:hypothetical protein
MQKDVTGTLGHNLFVFVATEEDVKFVDRTYFIGYTSILIKRHEWRDDMSSRAPKLLNDTTVVYWNPIYPITTVGVGETCIFSVLLTDTLFYCKTMIVDSNTPVCPIQILTKSLREYIPIAGETPLEMFSVMTDESKNNFLICFMRETPKKVRQLNIKRILTILEYRKTPAQFAFDMSDGEIQDIYVELKNEMVRRLIKGDSSKHCPYLNIHNLQYIKRAQQLLKLPESAQTVLLIVEMFQVLVLPYLIVPDILIKLNSIDRTRKVRLYCKNDSYAITSYGPVPNNMLEDNPVSFDYSDINTPYHLNKIRDKLFDATRIENLIVSAARYNYFF